MSSDDTDLTPQERRWFVAAFVLLAVASVLPIWIIRYHPLPDHADHLAAASIWHNYNNPRFDFQRYYELSLGASPYWVYYGAMHLLAYPLGLDLANRVLLTAYLVGVPLGLWTLTRRFERSAWLSLFGFPIAWTFNFTIGFISFALGMAIVPFALALFDRFCEKPGIARGIAAAVVGGGLFFCHLLPWGMYLGAAGLIGLLYGFRPRKALIARFCVWAAALAAGLLVVLRGSTLHMGGVAGRLAWVRTAFPDAIRSFYDWVWNGWQGHDDEICVAFLGIAWVGLMVTGWRKRGEFRWLDLRAAACFLTAITAYFVLPRSLTSPAYWWGINVRFAVFTVLFATLLVRGPIRGARRWLLAPLVAGALCVAVDTNVHWIQGQRFAAGYEQLENLPEPGSRVLFILREPWHDPAARLNYAQIYYGVYQAFHGGYMPYNFDEGFPIRYKVRYPAPTWRGMHFVWEKHAPYYDYVMAFQAGPEMFGAHRGEVTTVAQSGKWTLFKLPGPRNDTPPRPPYPADWALQ
jgi:hypothetical protein